MDLSSIEDLSEGQQQAILALHETDVTGLKSKNSELLGKINDSKVVVSEAEQIAEDARKAAIVAEEARLKAEGKYEEAAQVAETERATLIAKAQSEANTAKDLLKQRDLKDIHFDILNKVHDTFLPAAQAMLNASTDVTYGEDGKKVISIRSGDKEFNSTADFMAHAQTDATWSAMLKAPDTQGSGANVSNGGKAPDVDADYKQRLKTSGLIQ